jgi:catechol 2,3-dioxygenase-like lactoylglutathione lyase family enzyme
MTGPAVGLNHVSVIARDLDESVRFYVDVLGLEPVPTPDFGFPVQWLRIGDLQVHLFERPGSAPSHAHLALEVDDLMGIYRRAKELGVLDHETFGNVMQELPNGVVQMYIRDPSGNLIELDHRDASTIPRHEVPGYVVLTDVRPQEGDAARATLFPAR